MILLDKLAYRIEATKLAKATGQQCFDPRVLDYRMAGAHIRRASWRNWLCCINVFVKAWLGLAGPVHLS